MADIREDGYEYFHYDIPDFNVSIKKNYIPANVVLTDMSIHYHEEIEITYIVGGKVDHILNGKRVSLSAGEAIFINANQLHMIEPIDSDCELYCLIFNPMLLCASNYVAQRYVSPIIDNGNLDYFFLKESDEAQRCVLDAIVKIHELQKDKDFEIKVMSVLYEMWHALYEVLPKKNETEIIVNEDLHKVELMMSLIHKSYRDNLALEDICEAGAVGKTKGTKLFSEYLHMTPIEYLICYRLEMAMKLLEETNLSILDVALETGFSDSSYFARVFKNKKGMSPVTYRKNNKSN